MNVLLHHQTLGYMLGAWLLLYAISRIALIGNCFWLMLALFPVAALIALSLVDAATQRRRVFAQMYLRTDSRLYRFMNGKILLMLWQGSKAGVLALILVVQAILWPDWIWWLLGADALLLYVSWQLTRYCLASQVRSTLQATLARRLLVPLNTLICSLLIAYIWFISPQPDYRQQDLRQTLQTAAEQVELSCAVIAPLARLQEMAEALGLHVLQSATEKLHNPLILITAWMGFLINSALFTWAYSRLLFGASLFPEDVMATFRS